MKQQAKWWLIYGITILVVLSGTGIASQTVTTMSESWNPKEKVCIVIDPGHGGEDGGAVSVSGKPESAYNLKIAARLNDLLQLLGYETKMTRDKDISIYTTGDTLAQKKISDLKERVRIINNTENALLLSIHQNSFSDERFRGPQVFFSETEGSEKLAKHLQNLLVSDLNSGSHRKAKKSNNIYLMKYIRCPGVLIECGFLSNHSDEAALRDYEYQKKISALIAIGVSQYLSNT